MKKNILFSIVSIVMVLSSCNKMLEEDAPSQVTSAYLNTALGFNAAVNASYTTMRNFYGNEIGISLMTFGTDTYTNGADGSYKSLNSYNSDLNSRNAATTGVWNNFYIAINTFNAVISRAPKVIGMDELLKDVRVAEVRFLRAQCYFMLVQLYGPVPLTLEETLDAITTATRASVIDVYGAIIADLDYAVKTLPDIASDYGRATKPAAENLLAKVYLTRATSEAKQATDYAKAGELAKNVIANYKFKLLDDFAKVFEQGNGEINDEVIWSVQYNKNVLTNSIGNRLHLFFLMDYRFLPGMQQELQYGVPYRRFRPTDFTLVTLFDREHDARYKKSFMRTWLCTKPGITTLNNGKTVTLKLGDTAVLLPDVELTPEQFSNAHYSIYPLSKQTESTFPTLTKFLDPQRADQNETRGSRDVLVYRLAETYLIAAEALMMSGNATEAASLINVVRMRAANVGATPAETQANRLAMEINPSQLDIDFILDERARELLGENMRWLDLIRTGKLLERVKKYNPVAAVNIKPYHVLRPIPQDQIDRTKGVFEQNAGY